MTKIFDKHVFDEYVINGQSFGHPSTNYNILLRMFVKNSRFHWIVLWYFSYEVKCILK